MSTKIYTGFKISGPTLQDAFSVLAGLRPRLVALSNEKHARVLSNMLMKAWDEYAIAYHTQGPNTKYTQSLLNAKVSSVAWAVRDKLRDEQQKCRGSQERNPRSDCDAELFLCVHPTEHILGFLQEESLGVHKALLQTPGVSDFAYWNNVDPDETVSEQAWEHRRAVWNEVLDTDTFARVSMKIEPEPWNAESDISSRLLSAADRASIVAKELTVHRALYLYDQMYPRKPGDFSLYGVSRAMRIAERALKDENTALSKYCKSLVPAVESWLIEDTGTLLTAGLQDYPEALKKRGCEVLPFPQNEPLIAQWAIEAYRGGEES